MDGAENVDNQCGNTNDWLLIQFRIVENSFLTVSRFCFCLQKITPYMTIFYLVNVWTNLNPFRVLFCLSQLFGTVGLTHKSRLVQGAGKIGAKNLFEFFLSEFFKLPCNCIEAFLIVILALLIRCPGFNTQFESPQGNMCVITRIKKWQS